jgi:hypothetical protein
MRLCHVFIEGFWLEAFALGMKIPRSTSGGPVIVGVRAVISS